MALEREQSGAIDKFKLFMPIFLTYLRHRKKVIKELKEIIKEVDIDEIKLSIEDIYWSNKNFSYDFRGLTFKQRLEQNETL